MSRSSSGSCFGSKFNDESVNMSDDKSWERKKYFMYFYENRTMMINKTVCSYRTGLLLL